MLTLFKRLIIVLSLSLATTSTFANSLNPKSRTWKRETPKNREIAEARFMQGALDIGSADCETYFSALEKKIYGMIQERANVSYMGIASCGRDTPNYSLEIFVTDENDRPLLDEIEKSIRQVDLWGHKPVLRKISSVLFDMTVEGSLDTDHSRERKAYAWFVKRFKSYNELMHYIEDSLVPSVSNGNAASFVNWLVESAGSDQAEIFKQTLPDINFITAFGNVNFVTPENDVFKQSSKRGAQRDCQASPTQHCDQ